MTAQSFVTIPPIPLPSRRGLVVTLLAGAILGFGFGLPGALTADGRFALVVSALAILGWVGTRLPESLVALGAVLALVLGGVLTEAQLFAALGAELIWLLLAAFVIAAVAKDAGLTERLVAPLLRRGMRLAPLVLALTLAIAATAFVLPSTSGRAALLLPLFSAIATALPDPRLKRPLALLFPTVILLSAGASLIGAGAHLLAAQAIRNATGLQLGYLDWAMLGLPFSLLASLIGAGLILLLFVPRDLLLTPIAPMQPAAHSPEQRRRQHRIGLVLAAVVGLWLTAEWHGIGMALTALGGALVLLTPPFGTRKPKETFRAVDVELLLYMTATVLIAQSMTQTGTDRWLAAHALSALPAHLAGHGLAVAVFLSVIAVMAHLAITSRSARAAVLIPALALPVAGLGHDPALMVLIAVMGTGFCQSMMASAKPVAIFGNAEDAGFTQNDLARLALPLAPAVTALLIGFALLVWPAQLAAMRGDAPQPHALAPASLPAQAVALTPPAAAAPHIAAARPQPRPKGLTTPVAPSRSTYVPARDLRRIEQRINRALRPAGLHVVIR
ncbi:SLC13 family permease [Paracoccus laeviglucosivorans]|uniref:Di-and tricarboxylate transporter n=1 Tax=Paracoccus laeviglucosivorans TaxID=1197861 RepID=A0A521B9Z5_9RHOB|nr:SLC13 family permease [Paracoccus laeviglucosivorans]SMO43875.1 Di-and tricarboxylate transporter [Paracoccus laeviglucosivorans]